MFPPKLFKEEEYPDLLKFKKELFPESQEILEYCRRILTKFDQRVYIVKDDGIWMRIVKLEEIKGLLEGQKEELYFLFFNSDEAEMFRDLFLNP